MSRGGAATMRAVFKTNKALQEVKAAMAAASIDDADVALDKFAVIPLKNPRLRKWVDVASEAAGSGTFQNAVTVGTNGTADSAEQLLTSRVQQQGASPTSEDSKDELDKTDDLLFKVQQGAQESAQRAMAVSGEVDAPPMKSEVVGIATAAALAAVTDPDNENNLPPALRAAGLDPEQMAAALTDGRVLVAAGAGSGKSKTLVARVSYLVKDRKFNPARVLVSSFSTKASDELRLKISKSLGYPVRSTTGVQVGTMHSLFRKFIVGDKNTPGLGNPEERAMLSGSRLIAPSRDKGKGADREEGKNISPAAMSTAVRNMWLDCGPEALSKHFGYPMKWMVTPPKAKKAGLVLNRWRGNDVTLEQAKAEAQGKKEAQAVVWYEFYSGIKGDIPNWRPPCPSKAYDNFMFSKRKGGERLGDMDDMLKVFLGILRRDPKAKAFMQKQFDHILIDEVQDSNLVQHQILELMSEHIKEGTGKSIWMVGDESQAIYQFRGGRSELFTGLHGKGDWKTRVIQTNYRCAPEIVETANRLKEHNDIKVPITARPKPDKARGQASIEVHTPPNNASAAITTISHIAKDAASGKKLEDYAVLARTNAELNDFETACIINEIPYVRRGGKGFLDAPECKAVLGYIGLSEGVDYEKKKQDLLGVLMKPDRGLWMGPQDVERAIDDALDDLARQQRVDIRSIDPAMLLERRNVFMLADKLKMKFRQGIISKAVEKGHDISTGEWTYKNMVGELAENLSDIPIQVRAIREFAAEGTHSTEDLLNHILDNVTSTVVNWDPKTRKKVPSTKTLREQITNDIALFSDDDDDDDVEATEVTPEISEEGGLGVEKDEAAAEAEAKAGLGSVQFLFQMAVPNANDQANNTNPASAPGFLAKVLRYTKLADKLRIDPKKWEKEQERLSPEQRLEKPPAITLSTVHAVKGLEWENVSVLMPKGKFPPEPKPMKFDDPDADPPEPVDMEAERNLAYVALTRAGLNLDVICPERSGDAIAGISPFVFEAGLHVGQNVNKPNVTSEVEVEVKTAETADDPHPYVLETLARFAHETENLLWKA
jgi:superfamily I DNA/RNA helicase